MGTNYFLIEKPPCECCGRSYEPIHIGKSSAGWCFSLHVVPEKGIKDLGDWVNLWEKSGAKIFDEYGDFVLPGDMLKIIKNRKWIGRNENAFNFLEKAKDLSAFPELKEEFLKE